MNILEVLVQILISICIIISPFGIILGIFFLFQAHGEDSTDRKKIIKKRALWSIVGPILILFLCLIVWGLIKIIAGTFHA
mgnify:CR=1 FL=1